MVAMSVNEDLLDVQEIEEIKAQFHLSDEQLERIPFPSRQQMKLIIPHLPKERGTKRLNNRFVIGVILYVLSHGCHWRDIKLFLPHWQTYYMRFYRWAQLGIIWDILLARVFAQADLRMVMIDSTHLKAHRTACSMLCKEDQRLIGWTKGGRNTKLHAVCDAKGRLLFFILTQGQRADVKEAEALLNKLKDLPLKGWFLGDKGYDSKTIRDPLKEAGFKICIPKRHAPRKKLSKEDKILREELKAAGYACQETKTQDKSYNKTIYKLRNEIERMFNKLKDYRKLAMRYERSPIVFHAAICMASIFTFWL